ncbi:MAG: DNA double-strand break repair nuclease NurA [Acidimicrobiia bacterium]
MRGTASRPPLSGLEPNPDPGTTAGGSTGLEAAARRLAALLGGGAGGLADPNPASDLRFEAEPEIRPLTRRPGPHEVWAVDGGQCLVADARCVQLLATRAARVRFLDGECVLEDEGDIRATVLGGQADRLAALGSLGRHHGPGAGIAAESSVDVNLLRDHDEWVAVSRAVDDAGPGAMVLVDGDLQPDWRIPSTFLAGLLERAAARGVTLAGVTKHTSLARGGAPLLGWLEGEAEAALGPRTTWWARIGRTRADVGGVQVVAARLDPDARFSFRVDLPLDADAEHELGRLSALADDAAFPGYPYALSVADRLAACPGWLRAELRARLDDLFDLAGLPLDVRERAFTDRHALMERG